MPHYRTMYDAAGCARCGCLFHEGPCKKHNECRDGLGSIGAWDIQQGKDVIVTIDHVFPGRVTGEGGKSNKRPLITFKSAKKCLVLNKTNGKTIARLYGNETGEWSGKKIALYRTAVKAFGEDTEGVRVRPSVPRSEAAEPPQTFSEQTAPPTEEEAPGDRSPV